MTRNSTDNSFLVLGQTYLYWLENEVFPYLFGTICILELIVGVTVNIFIILLYKKHRKDDTFIINIYFIISDCVAQFFILLPAIIISLASVDSIASPLCSIVGIINNSVFVFQFGVFNFVLICTSLFLFNLTGNLYPRPLIVAIITAILVLVSLVLVLVPLATVKYELQKPEHRCGISKSSLKYITNISFVPFFGSLVSAVVALCFIIKSVLNNTSDPEPQAESDSEHQTELTEKTDESDNATTVNGTKVINVAETNKANNIQIGSSSWSENDGEHGDSQPEGRQSVDISINNEIPEHAWSHQESFSGTSALTRTDTDSTTTRPSTSRTTSPTDSNQVREKSKGIVNKYAVVADILSGKGNCKLHTRNAVMYMVMWLIMFVCWSPYVVFTYITMYSDLWWDGWLTVAVCVGFISYCTKPIVILTMRKDLRQKSAELLPQSLNKKAKAFELELKAVL